MGRGERPADGVRRHQGAVLQPPGARAHARPGGRLDRHDRAGRRWRLRGAGRVLSRGFSHSVRGPQARSAGEVDRGSARASDGDQSFPRGRLRGRGGLHARWRHPGDARARVRRHGCVYPHQWRRGAGQGGAVPARAVPHPRRRSHGRRSDDQQDTGRHHAGPGPVRGELLPRAFAGHGGARSRHRSDRIATQEPDHRGRAAVRHRQAGAIRRRDRSR